MSLRQREFVAAALGAREVSEYSLASRTGLLDQDTGLPWVEMLAYLAAVGLLAVAVAAALAPQVRGMLLAQARRTSESFVA